YGFGAQTAEHPDALAAPQATLMESVARGVFSGDLPWTMVFIGMGIGVAIIVIDKIQEARESSFRVPVLAVAVGIYLPFELDSAIMVGGVIAWLISRYQSRRKSDVGDRFEKAKMSSNRTGLLIASGLITGEALIGILLAIPVAIYGRSDVMALMDDPIGSLPGLIVVTAICYWLYHLAKKNFK
ncbi:MAG: OPT/YSL family transporter, partial [Saprospiraceae bacterium]|nr:OPT/YSL family transporter [Saprospiraceae bacterium]